MKIPLLILCLAVVYGSCRMYDEENVDVVKEIQNNEDYKVNIANVPFERFLARHKRASLLSPITTPIDMTLHLLNNSLMSTIVNFMKLTFGALTERDLCPKVEKLSIELIPKAVLYPIETIKTIACYIFQVMGTQGQTLMTKAFQTFREFFRQVFLPALHKTLDVLKNTGFLPKEINALIEMFDFIYRIMQITGYTY